MGANFEGNYFWKYQTNLEIHSHISADDNSVAYFPSRSLCTSLVDLVTVTQVKPRQVKTKVEDEQFTLDTQSEQIIPNSLCKMRREKYS